MSDTEQPQGFKAFNSTGRDDSTTEIIKPKGDPRRNAIFAAVVVALVAGLCWYGFRESKINPFAQSKESHGFGRGNVDIGKPTD